VVICLSCTGIQTFAADEKTVRQYGKEGGFLAIGDSIFRGYGSKGYFESAADTFSVRTVEGSAPYLVAEKVGCDCPPTMNDLSGTYWPLCYPGQTLGMTMDIYGIEDGLTDIEFNWMNYDVMLEAFGYEGSCDGVNPGETYTAPGTIGNIVELTKNASLIAVELGMCDVFYRALRISSNNGSFAGGFNLNFDDPKALAEFVTTFLSKMNEGYEYWLEYFPVFLKYLKELNPEADIVVVGAFDMVQDVELTDDLLLPLGTAVAAITTEMNVHMKEWVKDYDLFFADISNVETASTQYDMSFLGKFLDNPDVATHPTPEGHEYIARQILSVLQEKEKTNNIVVDLGRFENVSYVLVNGIPTDKYSMNGNTISVFYSETDATSLTVAVVGENQEISVQTYQLSYSKTDGYTAYRIYGTNDLIKTLIKPFKNIISLISKLFKK